MAHDAADWSIWGRDFPKKDAHYVALDTTKTGEPVIVLPPDGARQALPDDVDRLEVHLRTRRGDFHCLVPGCGAFASAVRSDVKRHHFRHAKASPEGRLPGHEPESIHHRSAKHELARWLRLQLGEELSLLKVDEYLVSTPRGEFEPDVYAELRNGVRIAIEYQYSPGDPVTVRRKQEGYAAAGITCWWIFASYNRTLVIDDSAPASPLPRILPTTVQHDLAAHGVSFHWFHLERRLIGTPYNLSRKLIFPRDGELWESPKTLTGRSYLQRPWRNPTYVFMKPHSLDDCHVDLRTGELITPTALRIDRDTAAAAREEASLREEARRRFVNARKAERRPVPSEPLHDTTSLLPSELSPDPETLPDLEPSPPAETTSVVEYATPGPRRSASVLLAPEAPRKPWWRRWLRL